MTTHSCGGNSVSSTGVHRRDHRQVHFRSYRIRFIRSCHRSHRGVILSLFTANMLWLHAAYGQRLYGSFGPVAERSLGFTPAGLAVRVVPSPVRTEVAVLSQTPPALHLFALSDSGTVSALGVSRLSETREGLVAGDLDGDGEPEFVTLGPDGSALSVLKRKGGTYLETVLGLPCKAQRVALADINNDRVIDIILYGKGMSGVCTLLGKKGGGFVQGPDLFTEVPISDLKTLDINGDGILDVVVCNWLSNQLTIFYGISRMVFSEQITVDLPGEPAAVSLVWANRRRVLGIAVALTAEKKLVLLRGTPDGDVQVDGVMAIPGKPSAVGFASVNDDAFPDIIAPTDRGMVVSMGAKNFEFSPPMLLGPGAESAGWATTDLDGDRHPDLVAAERTTQRLVFIGNSMHGDRVHWPSRYAVGSKPRGLAVEDFDGDGLLDIAVANSNSSTVSILFNQGKGKFHGQQSLAVAEGPIHVTAPEIAVPGMHSVVSSHSSAEMIGVVSWTDSPGHATSFAIPTGTQPYALYAWQDTASLSILVRYPPRGTTPVSLSLFEQLSGKQFLERSVRASLPDRISAVTVDRTGATTYCVTYVSFDDTLRRAFLSTVSADRSFSLGRVEQALSFADSLGSTSSVIPVSLTSPGSRDLVIVLGKPVNAFALARRNREGMFTDSLEWIPNVRIDDDDDVIVKDVDGDGRADITLRNVWAEEVMTFYGSAAGFGSGTAVCSARGVGAIAVASLVSPGSMDLVFSRSGDGTVSILHAPFRRSP